MSRIALIYALYGDADQAEAAAREAVERRFAACANILSPCVSIYRWDDAVQRDGEVPVLFKTRPDLAEALAGFLRATHGYAIPAISHWDAETSEAYADWVVAETNSEAISPDGDGGEA